MKIVIGCDHAGYNIKNAVKKHIEEKGYEVIDVGTNSSDSCHYPVYASAACQKILDGECELGILICGTGIGMSIAANKHKGIRAAACSEAFSAELTRQHNDANVLCLGARVIDYDKIQSLTDLFLTTEFMGGKHATRVGMLSEIENGTFSE